MFESVARPDSRDGVGKKGFSFFFSIAAHIGLIVAIILASLYKAESPPPEPVSVTFFAPPPPPPPPPPPAKKKRKKRKTKKKKKKPKPKTSQKLTVPVKVEEIKEIPQVEPEELEAAEEDDEDVEGEEYGVEGGVEGGVVGGVIGGVVGGVLGGVLGGQQTDIGQEKAVFYRKGMVKPVRIRGFDPDYPPEAKAAGIEGTIICIITISSTGDVINVQFIKTLPMMEEYIRKTIMRWKFRPAKDQDGRPIAIKMKQRFKFELGI